MYVENKLNETSHLGLSDDGDVAERTLQFIGLGNNNYEL